MDRLYCANNGRPAIDPAIMAGVTLLQFMEQLPDAKAVERVRLDLGWKYALDLPLDFEGFHATSLVVFRGRLLQGEQERVVFDAILESLRDAGLVRKRSKQRLDSTHVLGAVAKRTRLDVVRETIRLVLEEMERQGVHESFGPWDQLVERYRDSEINWRTQTREQLKGKFDQAGRDARTLVVWLRQQACPLRDHDRVLLLQRVFLEQYELAEAQVAGRKKEVSGGVQNPHDPDVQWATKTRADKQGWEGYKAHPMETVPEQGERKKKGEPTEQFVTEMLTTGAITSDLSGMDQGLAEQQAHGQDIPPELYVDAAYVTEETLAQAEAEGRELIGPARPSPSKHGVFPAEAFDVDVSNRKAVCPAGKTSTQCSRINDSHKGESYYRFEWASQCDECALQKQCTKSNSGRRILMVGLRHDLLQNRRREMETQEFQQRMRQRNAIEGTISELARLGLRRTRYRGLAKTRLGNYFIAAACNVNRWLRLSAWRIRRVRVHG